MDSGDLLHVIAGGVHGEPVIMHRLPTGTIPEPAAVFESYNGSDNALHVLSMHINRGTRGPYRMLPNRIRFLFYEPTIAAAFEVIRALGTPDS
jgi:hypothetical protein